MTFAPYQSHSSTSRDAAIAIHEHAPTMRERVLAELRRAPATDQQLAERLSIPENSARPRRIDLLREGLIEAHAVVTTKAGRKAQAWRVKSHIYQATLL